MTTTNLEKKWNKEAFLAFGARADYKAPLSVRCSCVFSRYDRVKDCKVCAGTGRVPIPWSELQGAVRSIRSKR